MVERPCVSIVLPVFNEERNIPLLADRYAKIAKRIPIEVLLVEDGGSKDRTRAAMRSAAKRYAFLKPVFTRERGYGISIWNGLKRAKGDFIGWTHADLQTDPADVVRAYRIAKNTQHVFVKGQRSGRPLLDRVFTAGMSCFESCYLRTVLRDINAQPNLFHRSFLRGLSAPPHDFAFDLFMLYTARRRGWTVVRFPVRFPPRKHGESAWNTGLRSKIRFSLRTIRYSRALKRRLGTATHKNRR